MAARVVLITGCSSGIGLSTAVLLAKDSEKRFKVYATMRNLAKKDKLEEAGKASLGDTLFIKQLDVCSDESVAQALDNIFTADGRIDVVVNNAGVGLNGALESLTMDAVQSCFDTNFFGLLRVTKAVLPNMKAHKEGHIINVSSMAGINGVPFFGVYCASKFAVEGLTESLAPLLKKFNVRCSLIEPGPVSTEFNTSARASSEVARVSVVDEETKELMENVVKKMQAAFSTIVQTADEVAEVIKEALLSEKPHFRYQTNKMYASAAEAKLTDPTGDKPIDGMYQRFFS